MKPSIHVTIASVLAALLATSDALAVAPPEHSTDPGSPHILADHALTISHEIPVLELAQAEQRIDPLVLELSPATKSAGTVYRAIAASHSAHRDRPLLILVHDLNPETQTQLEEDLTVMSRILNKAAQSNDTSTRGPRAMGIDLVMSTGSGPARTLYLDGFGAVFMVDAGFPLLPPDAPEVADSTETKSETETVWEETRQEIYGRPEPAGPLVAYADAQPYDATKVDTLRASLVEALKNATNIRQLADDESVLIHVTGATIRETRNVRVWRQESSTKDEQLARELVFAHRLPTGDASTTSRAVMTIQASKSDIDQFARRELTLEQFRERVRTHTYMHRGATDWSPNSFLWSNH